MKSSYSPELTITRRSKAAWWWTLEMLKVVGQFKSDDYLYELTKVSYNPSTRTWAMTFDIYLIEDEETQVRVVHDGIWYINSTITDAFRNKDKQDYLMVYAEAILDEVSHE